MSTKTYIFIGIALGLFIGGIAIGYQWAKPKTDPVEQKKEKDAEYIKNPNFKPDTIFLPGGYVENKIPYGIPVKPKIVTKYVDTGSTKYIDTSKRVKPEAKGPDYWLDYAEIGKDTLKLDYKSTKQTPHTEYVLTNYSKYKYQYLNNSIFAKEIKTTPSVNITQKEKNVQYTGTYVNGGYELSNKVYSIGATSGFNLWKFRIVGYGTIPINNATDKNPNDSYIPNSKPTYGVRVGYKIF